MSLVLSYIYGAEIVCRPGEELQPRVLTDYELVYMISGHASYTVGRTTYEVPPGTLLLGQPGRREHYRWDPESKSRHAFFHFDMVERPADWPPPDRWPSVQPQPPPIAIHLFRHILQLIYQHADWPATPPSANICRRLAALLDIFIEPPPLYETHFEQDRPEPVRQALKWMRQIIDDTPHLKFTLAEVAGVAEVTEKHLCRLFIASLGHSPMQTASLLRQQLALTLLARTNLSVKEIAERCGFDDPLYFSRCFRRTFGAPPSRIRKQIALGKAPPGNPLPVDITPRICW